MCHLTSVELVSTAVKTLTSLTDHCGPTSGDEAGDLTSDPVSWGTAARLLDSLHLLSRLHLRQGAMREALYYTREGVGLARKVALAAWSVAEYRGMYIYPLLGGPEMWTLLIWTS